MQRVKGVGLIVLGIFLLSIVLAMLYVQPGTQLSHWLTVIGGFLMALDAGSNVRVALPCGCAALMSGFLLLTNNSSKAAIASWQIVRFLLHLAVIYAITAFWTPRFASWTRTYLLPHLNQPTSSSSFQFLFSHIFEFSFVPAAIAGLANAKWKHKAAQYVWLVPAVILAYELVTFPRPARSVLDSTSSNSSYVSAVFHQYFGGGFMISDYHDLAEFVRMVRLNPDMMRGMTQLEVTAPFYAGVGYCLAAWCVLRFDFSQRLGELVRAWKQSRRDSSLPE